MNDILVVDPDATVLERVAAAQGPAHPSTLGNDAELRTWVGDLAALPDYQVGAGGEGG